MCVVCLIVACFPRWRRLRRSIRVEVKETHSECGVWCVDSERGDVSCCNSSCSRCSGVGNVDRRSGESDRPVAVAAACGGDSGTSGRQDNTKKARRED